MASSNATVTMQLVLLVAFACCFFKVNSQCYDNHRSCNYWATRGYCRSNPNYMLVYCKKSCNQCRTRPASLSRGRVLSSPSRCADQSNNCGAWARNGECRRNPGYMLQSCKKSCGKCPVNGRFSSWGPWGRCSKRCGGGIQYRSRSCNNPRPSNGGKTCQGNSREQRRCNSKGCPVNGGFSSWGSWGKCNKNCGGGIKYRQRFCNNPSPANGGKSCAGSSRQQSSCNTHKCPVNGGFSSWGSWGKCNKNCGGGIKYRQRFCNNPSPANGGKSCAGSSREQTSCNTHKCPVNGGFGSWGSWGKCDKNCGGGIKYRQRFCNNPSPANGGKNCAGSWREHTSCNTNKCPVNGGFSSWGSWGKCNKNCGGGIKYRQRSCNNPSPANGGKSCAGSSREQTSCNTHKCPVHGGYSSWGSYGPCDKLCGGGFKYRERFCNSPMPEHGGKSCVGSAKESASCNTQKCPVDGGYSPWGPFGKCSKPCGIGLMNRFRFCDSPSPANGGKPCKGASRQSMPCNFKKCEVDGGYSPWGPWSPCSKSCGFGLKSRSRSCDNPVPSGGGKPCSEPSTDVLPCSAKECKVDGGYSPWGPWSPCSKSCGFGLKSRSRFCNNPAPSGGGKPCTKRSSKTFPCKVKECSAVGALRVIKKPGKCAVITESMKSICPPAEIMNLDECTRDELCDGTKKCCSDGCFLKCVDPL